MVFQGLKSRADLNGKQGVVTSRDVAGGRFVVKLQIKPGTKKDGVSCAKDEECESYRCDNDKLKCKPGKQGDEIKVKSANLKLVKSFVSTAGADKQTTITICQRGRGGASRIKITRRS